MLLKDLLTKLDEKDVDVIAEDARQFVRKSPALAIGAAAAVGFVLARLVPFGWKRLLILRNGSIAI